MNTILQFTPFAIMLMTGYAADKWGERPSVRARVAALSLRAKIARCVRISRYAIAYQAGWLILLAGLRMSGLLSFSGWLAGTILAGIILAVDLYLLRNYLAARRAYDDLDPLTYLAEIQHAFGPVTAASAGSDQSEVTP